MLLQLNYHRKKYKILSYAIYDVFFRFQIYLQSKTHTLKIYINKKNQFVFENVEK